MKRQPIEWEKIFANHIFHKGFKKAIHEKVVDITNYQRNSNQNHNKEFSCGAVG